jgi:hypothetical protein
MTMGIVLVASLAARIAGTAEATMTSTFKLGRESRETLVLALRPTGLNGDVLTFYIAQFAHSTPEGFEDVLHS